jgi:multidrug efflux pump subunit AcrB
MSMNFATWSLRNPIPAILMFVLLSLAGLRGFEQLSIQALPDMELPAVSIVLAQPGAAPAQLEVEVARKVENSLAAVGLLKHTRTSITEGQVEIRAEFALEKRLSDALLDTKDAVDRIRSDLPVDLLQPAVSAVTVGGGPILTYAIASTRMTEEALSWFVDDTVSKALLAVPGVGRVDRQGGVQREVRVEVDPVRLAAHGVTAVDVSRGLRRTQLDASGGRTQLGLAEQSVRTVATVRQAHELAALPLTLTDGRELRLDQVATVHDASAQRTQGALLNGQPVVGFSVYRAKGFDETRIADGVAKAIAKLEANDPKLRVTPVSGSVDYTREQYRGSMQMLYEGAILAVLVVWWFLRDWRATLVAAAALPLSILPAFAAMAWLGYSLNMLTLLALAVVVGILVDDAIVEIENIERHRRMGKPVQLATVDAVNEIALAVIATTMTLVVVFVPTALMSGIPGLLFKQFGWTVVIAVLSSLLVARLLTPMMAAWLLKERPHEGESGKDGALMRGYLAAVRWCLAHRKTTLGAATAFFLGALALVPLIPSGLIPPSDRGFISVNLELAPGSSLAETLAASERARLALVQIPGVRGVFTAAGVAPPGGDAPASDVRRSTLTLVLAPRDERPGQMEVEKKVRQALAGVPGARFAVAGEGPGEKLSLILASDNAEALKSSAQAFERELRSLSGLTGIASTASLERPEIVVRPDLQRAAELGVSTAVIGETVRIATSGDFDAQLAKLNLDQRQVGIRVSVADAARQDLAVLSNLRVPARTGLVPLGSVATLSLESGPAQIDRFDRQRYVTVSADLGGMPMGPALAAARALPAALEMPSGVAMIETGDAELASELASGFGMAILVGVLCMFCVLVLLFKDFLQPVTILSAIPLSLGGAFIALVLARSEFNVPSMIGLVMLMGIVAKNSILLVEYAVVGIRDRGLSMFDALVDACHKRARPIIMTTFAMIAGMLPIALGLGPDASFRQPMAISVIGGLVTSTLLSLLVVPVVFTYAEGVEQAFKRRFARRSPMSASVPASQAAP